jgi:hypothetical protein
MMLAAAERIECGVALREDILEPLEGLRLVVIRRATGSPILEVSLSQVLRT